MQKYIYIAKEPLVYDNRSYFIFFIYSILHLYNDFLLFNAFFSNITSLSMKAFLLLANNFSLCCLSYDCMRI